MENNGWTQEPRGGELGVSCRGGGEGGRGAEGNRLWKLEAELGWSLNKPALEVWNLGVHEAFRADVWGQLNTEV